MTNEEHAREFLEYVAKNEKRLKKNLRKNITYDDNLFDDIFQDTIIKVHSQILKGQYIEDFEKYFFIASKFNYINADNKKKREKKRNNDTILWNVAHGQANTHNQMTEDGLSLLDKTVDDNEYKEKEERLNNINVLFNEISNRLNEVYRCDEVDIFLIYYRLKSEKTKISYKKMAEITQKSTKEIASIIQKMKLFLRNDEEIINIKKRLLK